MRKNSEAAKSEDNLICPCIWITSYKRMRCFRNKLVEDKGSHFPHRHLLNVPKKLKRRDYGIPTMIISKWKRNKRCLLLAYPKKAGIEILAYCFPY